MTRDRHARFRLVACLLALGVALACWLQASCGARAAAAVVTHAGGAAAEAVPRPPAPTNTADAEKQLKAAQDRADASDRQAELDHAEAKRLGKVVEQIAARDLQRRLAWVGGIVLLGVLACVGLWFVLPAGLKSWAVYGGLGCIGVAGAAFALRALVPYLELVGWGLVAAGAAFGLWKLARFKRAGAKGAEAFDLLEQAFVGMKDWLPEDKHQLVDDLIANVKHEAAVAQEAAGVRGVLAAIRGKDRHAPTTPPPMPPPGGAG